jgi:hypothetical protein
MALIPVAKQRPFNPRTADWAVESGNQTRPIRTVTKHTDIAPIVNGAVVQVDRALWTTRQTAGLREFLKITNSTITQAVQQSAAANAITQLIRCTVDVDLPGMPDGMFNGGCLFGSTWLLYRTHVKSRVDGISAGDGLVTGGNITVIDRCHIEGMGTAYAGWPLLPSNIPVTVVGPAGTTRFGMTDAQTASVVHLAENTYYKAGQLIDTPLNGMCYQVSSAGTSGAGNVAGTTSPWYFAWPGGSRATPGWNNFFQLNPLSTAQPFADGPDTLRLVLIGPVIHGDGIQTGRYSPLVVSRTRIEGFANSCIFIQSSSPSPSTDPAGPFVVNNCDLEADANAWIYANTLGADPTFSGAYAGRWVRSSTGVWSAYNKPYLARPEYLTVVGNLFRNRKKDGMSPQFDPTRALFWAIWTSTTPGLVHPATSAVKGDYGVFVRDEETRTAAIARQWSSPGVINTAVLERRYQYGIFPGACDARSWIVWRDNVDENGALINPVVRVGGVFDAQGYYTGI